MAWEASDYAIFMTSIATLITAAGGVGIPLLFDREEKKKERRKASFERIRESLFFCVENIEKIIEIEHNNAKRDAYVEAKKATGSMDASEKELIIEFGKNFRRAQLHLTEIGVDCNPFVNNILDIRSEKFAFSFIENELFPNAGYDEIINRNKDRIIKIVDLASEMLKSARKILGVD